MPASLRAYSRIRFFSQQYLQTHAVYIHPNRQLKKSVVDALVNAGLDLNPMIEGNAVVVPIPRETKESREKLAKLARQQAEKSKQRVLKMRRDGIARLKTMKSDKSIGEDDFFALQKDVQSHADEYTAKIADTLKAKEGDLLGDSS